MKVILLDNIAKVGRKFDIVTVKDGYAQNFLIPQGKARFATPEAERALEQQRQAHAAEIKMQEEEIRAAVAKIDGGRVTLQAKVNEQGHLFANIHATDIAQAARDQLKMQIEDSVFAAIDDIKEAGEHTVTLAHGDATATLTVVVEAEK